MTLLKKHPAGDLTQFRTWIQQRLHQQQGRMRSQIIFAVDGIYHRLAERLWPSAQMMCWQAVFPPTSSTCWLSSLTGQQVDKHGVAGVVYRPQSSSHDLVNICDYQGEAIAEPRGNIFTDATRYGYLPQAIIGDLMPIEGSWTRALLAGAAKVDKTPFFTRSPLPSTQVLIAAIEETVKLALSSNQHPTLIWCFIDIDQYIHLHGYDHYVIDFLQQLEQLALRFTQQQTDVIAHADHGLVPTRHNVGIANTLNELSERFSAPMGGAGRTRWFYADPEKCQPLQQELRATIGHIADVVLREAVSNECDFAAIGKLVVIARGETFIAPDGYIYDHGSLLPQELHVPCALWKSV
ncbi:alkaline phosphatase family protein [Pectobacterium punjabense]|uniref:alkaline phosphatase family protein n=1 Tax=Pectobacterium punjabense TaxID=2108399 RepID=UPI0024056ABB|nr:alkaline phosphatase family protein [Pectobacterium punjabense]MDG0796067.1 alkaline phosphatase family protein [Pectobacterium punjabense]